MAPPDAMAGTKKKRRGDEATTALFDSWRSRRDSNPRCRFCPHTPLAGEHLRPLGHDSSTAAHSIPARSTSREKSGRSGFLVQIEGLVQGAHGQFHVLLVDDDAGLDLTGGDHLDVDAF